MSMTIDQPAFDFRATDPVESMTARPDPLKGCAADVVHAVETYGPQTADELAQRLPHRHPQTIAGICSHHLEDTGERRLTRRNRLAAVWGIPRTGSLAYVLEAAQ